MINVIHPSQKRYFVSTGKNHAFGTDFEKRVTMSPASAERRFDDTWNSMIKAAIEAGSVVDAEDVKRRVPEQGREFVKDTSEHREFQLSGSLWVAQITDGKNDQLWTASNKAFDTRSVTSTFKTQEEKDAFDALAREFGFDSMEFARRVLTAQLRIHQKQD